jgi:hypothetical protein
LLRVGEEAKEAVKKMPNTQRPTSNTEFRMSWHRHPADWDIGWKRMPPRDEKVIVCSFLSHLGQKIVVLRYLAIALVVARAFASDRIGQAIVIRMNPKTMSSGK